MRSHIKAVAILHIAFGIMGVLVGLSALAFFGGLAGFIGVSGRDDEFLAAPVLGVIGAIAFLLMFVISIPGIIAGIGLLAWKPWARIMTIVISALELLHVPIGTLLGVYGLWALLSPEGAALFQSESNAALAARAAPPSAPPAMPR